MNIFQINLEKPRHVKQFLELPFRIYRHIPQWVPPLEIDARKMLDRKRHPFYQHSDAAFFLAMQDDRVIGRIAVLDHRHYNEYNKESTVFFYLFECEDNHVASGALFDAAFNWARGRGLNKIIGPKGFSALDGMGLLVKGFEHRPALGIPYNPSYYPALIQAAGFAGTGDVVSGYLSADIELPEKIHRISELVQQKRGLSIARFKTRRDLEFLVPRLKELYNSSLQGTVGNYPITDAEVKSLADQILWFADPRLIKIVMKGEELVGYLFAYPDISAALQRTRGKLLPFGWLALLREMKRTKWVNLNGAGIIDKYRGLGGTAILFSEMFKSVRDGKFKHADLVQIGVDNDKMQRELRDLGIDFYKTHRMYARML